MTTEVASPISLVVSWRSPRPTILLSCINAISEVTNKMMMMMTMMKYLLQDPVQETISEDAVNFHSVRYLMMFEK